MQQPIVDDPVLRRPDQPAGCVLKLVEVRRRARRHTVAAVGRVIAGPPLAIHVERSFVLRIDHLVELRGQGLLLEDRTARCQDRLVVQQPIQFRSVPQPLIEGVARDRVPQRARDLVVGEGIPHDAAAHVARGARIVDLAEAHLTTERVGPDDRSRAGITGVAGIEQTREVAILELACRQRAEGGRGLFFLVRPLECHEEEAAVPAVGTPSAG